jgi:nitrite reductase/ring-hydroxylating ferredoxin subunit
MGKRGKKRKAAVRRQAVATQAAAVEPDPAPTPDAAGGPSAAGAPAEQRTAAAEPAAAAGDRRDFLALAGKLVVGLTALGGVAGGLRLAVADFAAGPPPRFSLGVPADYKMQTLTWLRGRDLFVLHDPNGFGAFSARCTHLGCTVQRSADGFACPCHGARFDPLGRVTAGPARTGLPWYAVWLETDGRLWIDLEREIAPGTRSLAALEAAGRAELEP